VEDTSIALCFLGFCFYLGTNFLKSVVCLTFSSGNEEPMILIKITEPWKEVETEQAIKICIRMFAYSFMENISWRQKIISETTEYLSILLRDLQALYYLSNIFKTTNIIH
jgi:hypothetical protein